MEIALNAAEKIDERALGVSRAQSLMGMLSDQIDQRVSDLLKKGKGSHAAIDEGAIFAFAGDLAADDEIFSLIQRYACFIENIE